MSKKPLTPPVKTKKQHYDRSIPTNPGMKKDQRLTWSLPDKRAGQVSEAAEKASQAQPKTFGQFMESAQKIKQKHARTREEKEKYKTEPYKDSGYAKKLRKEKAHYKGI